MELNSIVPHAMSDSWGDQKIRRDALLRTIIKYARRDFYTYLKFMAPILIPDEYDDTGKKIGGFVDGRHLRVMCEKLMLLENGDVKNLMFFMPPGSMKTVTILLFESWYLGRHPSHKILAVGHSADFAEKRFGKVVKELIQTNEFRTIFPDCKYQDGGNADWSTNRRGIYKTSGAEGQIAGQRANLGVLDDIVSEQSAYSKNERDKINNWYGVGFKSRLLPTGVKLVVNTRWHIEDISGFLLEQQRQIDKADKWTVVKFPAILDEDGAKLLGLPVGESFWPEFWPKSKFESIKATELQSKWNALYMQNPIADEGNLFQIDDFRVWEDPNPPECKQIIMTFDTAFSEKETADYSVILTCGIFHVKEPDAKGRERLVPNVIVLGMNRGRWGFPELRERAFAAYTKRKPDLLVIEKKASGQSLIQELRMSKLPIFEYVPDKSKLSRAHSVTNIISHGRVWFPALPWMEPMLDELKAFPAGGHDDIVDAFVMALIYLRDHYAVPVETDTVWDEEEKEKRKKKLYW